MQTDYDILIIGGGLVGASLGVALASLPLRIGLIEAVEFNTGAQPSYDDRSLALSYGSKRIYESLGVWGSLSARDATAIRQIHISDRGHFGFTRLDARDAQVEALGYVVANRALGQSLLPMLDRAANIEVISPARVEALDIQDSAAQVRYRRGAALETCSARLLVAADGGDSPVRQLAGIEARRTDYDQTALVTNITPAVPHAHVAYERFTPSGPLAVLPMSGNRCTVVWSLAPARAEELLALDDDRFLQALQEQFGSRLGALGKLGKRAVYPLALTRVQEHVRPRLVLIGNAAHTVHPVAGQGFNLGLRDVAVLAQILKEAQRAGRDPGDLAVLQEYADWRQRDNRVISTFTHTLVRSFSNDWLPVAILRNLGLVAVDLLPPVKRRLLRLSMGLAGRLPRLARGLPL